MLCTPHLTAFVLDESSTWMYLKLNLMTQISTMRNEAENADVGKSLEENASSTSFLTLEF